VSCKILNFSNNFVSSLDFLWGAYLWNGICKPQPDSKVNSEPQRITYLVSSFILCFFPRAYFFSIYESAFFFFWKSLPTDFNKDLSWSLNFVWSGKQTCSHGRIQNFCFFVRHQSDTDSSIFRVFLWGAYLWNGICKPQPDSKANSEPQRITYLVSSFILCFVPRAYFFSIYESAFFFFWKSLPTDFNKHLSWSLNFIWSGKQTCSHGRIQNFCFFVHL